ncbi:hypothetical protein SAMN06265360_12824 [Haloechinothrix alba]|uniref:DUF917 domain-containing protein n=1 Tax=Haloechinothrix alba TaxID=664784 RepID=A0A239A037_9PSEU|nr:hypothetical protein SAMN06265360_12824 [Haloechinothrix alba]
MHDLGIDDIADLVLGAEVLGSGGGGDSHVPWRMLVGTLAEYGPVRLINADELPADAPLLPVLAGGPPGALAETFFNGHEFGRLRETVEQQIGQPCAAVLPVQLGAFNTMIPLIAAARLGLPCIDADIMRRCFPAVEMTLFMLAGIRPSPVFMVDMWGMGTMFATQRDDVVSTLIRTSLPHLGMVALISTYTVTAEDCARFGARRALTDCASIGRLLRSTSSHDLASYGDFLRYCSGRVEFSGIVIDLVRDWREGTPHGTITLEAVEGPARLMRLEHQHENLVAAVDGELVVTVPDVIALIDVESGVVMQSADVVEGQRLLVIAIPTDARWHTPAGLELVGPQAFGLDVTPTRVGGSGG